MIMRDWFLLCASALVIRCLVLPSWECVAMAGVVLAARYGAGLAGLGQRLEKIEGLLGEVDLPALKAKLTRLLNHAPPGR